MSMNSILFLIMAIDAFLPRVFASETIEGLLRELSGSHLRFSATHIPPYLIIKKESNGTFSYQGLRVDMSNFLAQLLDITYSFVNAREDEENKVGLKEAAINLLMRDEVDIVTLTMGLNLDHFTRMDTSCPLTMVPFGMMVPWPEEETRLLAPIKPFQPTVWIWLFAVFITIMFALVWIPGLYFKLNEKKSQNNRNNITYKTSSIINYRDLSSAAVYVLSILTYHGKWTPFKQVSFRIVLASWCLGALVLANAYSGTLISFLLAPKLQPVTKSFDELAAGYPQRLKILSEKNQFLADSIFLPAESGAFKVLGDSLRNNPETLFTNRRKGSELMITGQYAYVAPETFLYSFMDEGNKRAGYCRFTVSTMSIPITSMYSVLTFHKHWRYTDAINSKMQLGRESGLYEYWTRKYKPNIDKCLLDHYQDTSRMVKKLTLSHLSSPLVLLLLGFSVSFIVFLIELIWYRIITSRNNINLVALQSATIIPIVKDNESPEGVGENNDNITYLN